LRDLRLRGTGVVGRMLHPKMLLQMLVAVVICGTREAAAEAASDSAVVALKDIDFEDGKMAATEFALVEFFAPWCGHCKKLEPEFQAAAQQLRDYQPRVIFAAVDATAEKVESSRQAVRGFPTLKWYVRGVAVDYNGERNTRSIVNWVKKKTGPPANELGTSADVDAFVRKHRVAVVAFVGAEDDLAAYFAAARGLDVVPFAFTQNAALRPVLVAGAAAAASGGGDATASASSALVVFKKPSAGFKHNSTAFVGTFSEVRCCCRCRRRRARLPAARRATPSRLRSRGNVYFRKN
jgi:protein disulfide-isomerase-like protein